MPSARTPGSALHGRCGGSGHDHFGTSLYIPLRMEGSLGVLSDALSADRWSPSEIHEYIVARSLLCDEPARICGSAGSSISADAPANRRNPAHRKSLHRPGLPHRMDRGSQWKLGSWRRVFLLGGSSETDPVGQRHAHRRKGPWKGFKRFKPRLAKAALSR